MTDFLSCQPQMDARFYHPALPKLVNIEKQIKACLKSASAPILTLHEAGIPIVAGTTDVSSGPVFPNFFHGTSMIREIELHKTGIRPMDKIRGYDCCPRRSFEKSHSLGIIDVDHQRRRPVPRRSGWPKNPLYNSSICCHFSFFYRKPQYLGEFLSYFVVGGGEDWPMIDQIDPWPLYTAIWIITANFPDQRPGASGLQLSN